MKLSTNRANWPADVIYEFRERVAICTESGVPDERAEEIAEEQVRADHDIR